MSTRDEKIKLDVTGADKSARDLNNVGNAAVKAGDSVYVMGQQADKAAKGVDELGDEAQQTGQQLSRLERDVLKAKAAVAALNAEYERGGGDKVLENLRAQQAELGKLEAVSQRVKKVNKELADDAEKHAKRALTQADERARKLFPGGDGGSSTLHKLLGIGGDGARLAAAGGSTLGATGSALGGAVSATGPYGSAIAFAAAVSAAVAASIPAGAGIGGAVGLGGAAAGAGLGLAGAWMGDPEKYGALWGATIDKLKKRWLDSSQQFGKPLEDSLKVVDQVVRDLPVERIADLSKGFVAPLVEGAGGFATNFADGLADSLERAQPIVDKFGPELANLGQDAGDALRAISLGSEGGALALGDLTNAIGYAVKATGVLIMGFENAYEKARNFESANFDFVSHVPVVGSAVDSLKEKLFYLAGTSMTAGRTLDGVGDSSKKAAFGGLEFASAAAQAATEAGTLTDALTSLRSIQLASADANLALAQGWLDLGEELKDGKRSLDASTQAGIDNQKAILQQVEAAEAARQKQIELTGDVDAANATYAANVEKIRQMAYAAGFNKEQVDALILSLSGLDKTNATPTIKVIGLGGAIEGTGALARLLASVQGTYNVHLNGPDGPSRHAGGGTMGSTGPKLVGELGAELIWGSKGEYVSTAQQTAALMRGGGAAAGPPIVRVILQYPDGRVARDQLVTTASNEGKTMSQFLNV